VKSGPAFTHISYDGVRINTCQSVTGRTCVCHRPGLTVHGIHRPQLGRIGLERDLQQQGRAYRVAKMPMNDLARAVELDESCGFMKDAIFALPTLAKSLNNLFSTLES
jgi:pyruvate/2-oxoglutarate dehydrogenase complex dihydrolipoamide dehydrogenase (E3) component